MSEPRKMRLVGGERNGLVCEIPENAYAWNVMKPPVFSCYWSDGSDLPADDPMDNYQTYEPRTLVVGPPSGHEGPHYAMRIMMWNRIRDARDAIQIMQEQHRWTQHRAEAIRQAIERIGA